MRKYLKISIVLACFFLIVFFRRQSNGNVNTIVDNSSNNSGLGLDNNSESTNNQPSTNSSNDSPSSSSSSSSSNSTPVTQSGSNYKNGSYDGSVGNAYYGDVQVRITISNGKLSNLSFLQYPNDNNTSSRINAQALPTLKSEALQAQSAQVDGVSGASYTSQAFQDSLKSALQKAS